MNRLKANPFRRKVYRAGDAPGGLATDDVERPGRRTSCRRRRTKQCDSQQAPQLAKYPAQGRTPRSESTLEHRDDIARPDKVLPGGPALQISRQLDDARVGPAPQSCLRGGGAARGSRAGAATLELEEQLPVLRQGPEVVRDERLDLVAHLSGRDA